MDSSYLLVIFRYEEEEECISVKEFLSIPSTPFWYNERERRALNEILGIGITN